MTIIGTPRIYDLKFKFRVEIDGIGSAGYKSCSELTAVFGEAVLWQGGAITPIKELTRLTFSDITLERGASRDIDLWNWFKQGGDAASGRGLPSPGAERHGSVTQYNIAGAPVERHDFFRAKCKEYSGGDWDNDSDDFRMERVVLSIGHFDRAPLVPA